MVRDICDPSWLAWEVIPRFFSVRNKFVSGITHARKAHCQKSKALKKSRTDGRGMRLKNFWCRDVLTPLHSRAVAFYRRRTKICLCYTRHGLLFFTNFFVKSYFIGDWPVILHKWVSYNKTIRFAGYFAIETFCYRKFHRQNKIYLQIFWCCIDYWKF